MGNRSKMMNAHIDSVIHKLLREGAIERSHLAVPSEIEKIRNIIRISTEETILTCIEPSDRLARTVEVAKSRAAGAH